MGLAIIAINMAMLGATALRCQSKTRLHSQQRRGSITRDLPREAVKIKVANGAAMAARAGTTIRVSEISEWEQELWKGLREEGLERDGRQRLGVENS